MALISQGLYIDQRCGDEIELFLRLDLVLGLLQDSPSHIQMLFPFFTGSIPILSEVLVLGITFEVHFPWVQHVTSRSAGSHVVATQTVAWTAKGDHIDAPEIPLVHNHKNSIVMPW